jgi:hypothetical protein
VSIRALAATLALTLGGSTLFAAPLPCTSISEYRTILEHISAVTKSAPTEIDELIADVPIECEFGVKGKEFTFSNTEIHSGLFSIKTSSTEDRPAKIESLQTNVALRLKALDSYTAEIDPTAKPKLEKIFTRGEFKRVGKQSIEAIFRERMMALLVALFSYLTSNPEQAALFAEVFVWSVVGLVVLFILWRFYRWASTAEPAPRHREILPFSPSAKHWRRWMDEARTALAAGELREAVHSSYWAAISHLESSGSWTPDKARTPREYLGLIARSNPARPSLVEISRVFEIVWYGERIPALAECEEFLARVEQIACR